MKQKTLNKNELNLTKSIFQPLVKTLLYLFFAMGFVILSLCVIAPRLLTPVLTTLGCDNANYLLYKRIYKREQTNQNLYNIIQLAIENEKYEDQVEFINVMLNGDDFDSFCESVDKKTKEALGYRYSVYVDSYESYLRRHLVEALYKSGESLEAKMLAIDSAFNKGKVDDLYIYVKMIVDDEELLDMQKEAEFITLYKRYGLLDALSVKLGELEIEQSVAENNYSKVVVLEQKIKLAEIEYYIGKYNNEASMKDLAENNIKNWTEEIKNLLNQM